MFVDTYEVEGISLYPPMGDITESSSYIRLEVFLPDIVNHREKFFFLGIT